MDTAQTSARKVQKGNAKRFVPPDPVPTVVPRFSLDALDEAMGYLDNEGYCVISGVMDEEQRQLGIKLAWDFLEGLDVSLDRSNVKTWETPRWPDPFRKGIVAADGVGQSEFQWFCRGLKSVQEIFQRLWNTDELITSFDGFNIQRPFEYNPGWRSMPGMWYHVDQNGWNKPNKVCVQGFLNFYDSDEYDGGLVVVPRSHLIFYEFVHARPRFQSNGDFLMLNGDATLWEGEIKDAGLSPIKVCVKAGDFVLWDSRTIHCNAPSSVPRPLPRDGTSLPPRRLVSYICMTPASRLTHSSRAHRITAYKQGDTTSHWPEDVTTSSARRNSNPYKPPKLTPDQLKLIPL